MKYFYLFLAVVILLGVCGCAGNKQLVGKQTVVDRMPNSKPDWVEKSAWTDKDSKDLFYTGGVTNVSDMAVGLREARAEGEKKIAEQVKSKIRTEFGKAVEGQNVDDQLGRYVKDIIAKVSENVEIQGISQDSQYIEKVEEISDYGVKYKWNCYVLLKISDTEYKKALANVGKDALKKAQAEKNVKAEESLKKAFEKLEAKIE